MKKTALITGANRGLGLEFVSALKERGYHVIACCRHPLQASPLKGLADEILPLDMTKDEDINNLVKALKDRPIDLLLNNAGITGENGVTLNNVKRDNFLQVLDVNCVGTIKLCDALLPNIKASQEKSILVISSQMGSISDNTSGRSYAYRASKAALNCVMRSFAIDVQEFGIKVMLLHPGWVKTDMGGPNALVDIQSSVRGMLKQVDEHLANSHAEILRRFDGGTIGW